MGEELIEAMRQRLEEGGDYSASFYEDVLVGVLTLCEMLRGSEHAPASTLVVTYLAQAMGMD